MQLKLLLFLFSTPHSAGCRYRRRKHAGLQSKQASSIRCFNSQQRASQGQLVSEPGYYGIKKEVCALAFDAAQPCMGPHCGVL